mmetsp:Transcript_45433/g.83103  ORF Transcript_45433/g.83103 Transcript_45433/m.83103 type:complete len:301 (+) Transcript_45433:220-1122(+)
MPHTAPQKVSATTTIKGCSSRPSAINCGSMMQPKLLWIKNGTSTTMNKSWNVDSGSKNTKGTGNMIAKKAPMLGMKFSAKVHMPHMISKSTCRTHNPTITARVTINVDIALKRRYRCINLCTLERRRPSWMPGSSPTKQKKNKSSVSMQLFTKLTTENSTLSIWSLSKYLMIPKGSMSIPSALCMNSFSLLTFGECIYCSQSKCCKAWLAKMTTKPTTAISKPTVSKQLTASQNMTSPRKHLLLHLVQPASAMVSSDTAPDSTKVPELMLVGRSSCEAGNAALRGEVAGAGGSVRSQHRA